MNDNPTSGFASFVPLILMFVIFYFLLIRPQQKRNKMDLSSRSKFLDIFKKLKDYDINVSYGGVPSDNLKSDSTRVLAGSMITLGNAYRKRILKFIRQSHKAIAPELGIDIDFVYKLCLYFDKRESRYQTSFFIISLLIIFPTIYLYFSPAIYRGEATYLIAVILISYILCWALKSYKEIVEHRWLSEHFKKYNYNPEELLDLFNTKTKSEDHKNFNVKESNVLIYKGFNPFIGAGINLGGWSFAVDLKKHKKSNNEVLEQNKFEVIEIYDAVNSSLKSLELAGMKISDILVVNGSNIRNNELILKNKFAIPEVKLPNDYIYKYSELKDPYIRFYKWIKIFDWSNELIVSYFLRCLRQGNSLFVEFSYSLLTPLGEEFKLIDNLASFNNNYIFALISKSFMTAALSISSSWFLILSNILKFKDRLLKSDEKKIRKEIENNPYYNYGAKTSLREMVSSNKYQHYFQILDKEMYVKIIEKKVLDTLVDFLDDHNIDTSDLKERKVSIVNKGVFVQHGDVKAGAIAVGDSASATQAQNTGILSKIKS